MNGIVRFLVGLGLTVAAIFFFFLTGVAWLFLAVLAVLAFLLNVGGIRSYFGAGKEGGTWVVTSYSRKQSQNVRARQLEEGPCGQNGGTQQSPEGSGPCVDLDASDYRRVRRKEGDQSS